MGWVGDCLLHVFSEGHKGSLGLSTMTLCITCCRQEGWDPLLRAINAFMCLGIYEYEGGRCKHHVSVVKRSSKTCWVKLSCVLMSDPQNHSSLINQKSFLPFRSSSIVSVQLSVTGTLIWCDSVQKLGNLTLASLLIGFLCSLIQFEKAFAEDGMRSNVLEERMT